MAEKEGVMLLGMWASPFTRRIEMALKLKGLSYEYSEQELFNKSPLLLELNPVHKKIPVLVHNGKPIAESLVILEYIDDTWPNRPLLPQGAYQRATARFWAKFVDEHVLAKGLVPMVKADAGGREALVKEVQELIKLLEEELVGKDFFSGGATVGFLDIVAFSMIECCLTRMWEVLEADVLSEDKFPNIYEWIGKMSEINEVKGSIPPKAEHVQYFSEVVVDKIRSI